MKKALFTLAIALQVFAASAHKKNRRTGAYCLQTTVKRYAGS